MNILQATHTKTFKHKAFSGLLLFFCVNFFLAQNKLSKLDKEFSFSQIPLFKLNSSHTQIILTTWDKNIIGINAYSLGETDDDYLKSINDLWEINIQKTDSIFILNTDASKQLPAKIISSYSSNIPSSNTQSVLLKSMLDPMLSGFNNVSMPEVLKERINESKFDFDAYNQLGETYFKIWEYNLIKGLDDQSAKEVRNWYDQMTSRLSNVSRVSNVGLTTKSENSSKENVSYSFYESHTVIPNISTYKVIELKIPKQAISYFDTRFGSVKINNNINNLQAKLKYTSLKAKEISGKETLISVSSAPLQIEKWNTGSLQLKYVKNSEIGSVGDIVLEANSSKTLIHSLIGGGKFKSTFSQLGIDNTSANFSTLSFLSTNSDLILSLPDQSYNFVYSGEMSGIKIPPHRMELKSLGDYRNLMLHGYSQSRNTDREIQMNMVNSQILLK